MAHTAGGNNLSEIWLGAIVEKNGSYFSSFAENGTLSNVFIYAPTGMMKIKLPNAS